MQVLDAMAVAAESNESILDHAGCCVQGTNWAVDSVTLSALAIIMRYAEATKAGNDIALKEALEVYLRVIPLAGATTAPSVSLA